MAEAKSKTTSKKKVIPALNDALESLAAQADETNAEHRAAVLKLEATIKYITARWTE